MAATACDSEKRAKNIPNNPQPLGPFILPFDLNKEKYVKLHDHVQHDCTKHAEVDRHFIKEKLELGLLKTKYVATSSPLADLLAKGLLAKVFEKMRSNLGISDIHSLA